MSGTGFLDITATDLIGAYLQKQQSDNDAKVAVLQHQAEIQQAAFRAPEYDSAQDAVNTGYAAPVNSRGTQSFLEYWERIPKPLLYSGVILLGAGLLFKAVK